MKKLFLILFTFVSSFAFAQNVYTHSDSVDIMAVSYLNMYRAYYKLPAVKLDKSIKDRCVAWCDKSTKSMTLRHTTYNDCAETVYFAPFWTENLNKETNFSLFVKKITKKSLIEFKAEDIVILESLYSWENSPGHKKILTLSDYTTAYFAITYDIKKFTPNVVWFSCFSIIEMR